MANIFFKIHYRFQIHKQCRISSQKPDISLMWSLKADLSSFILFCIEFLSLIMSNQVLYHMNEMGLNLVLFAKLEIMAIVNTYVKMQQSVQVRELHRLYKLPSFLLRQQVFNLSVVTSQNSVTTEQTGLYTATTARILFLHGYFVQGRQICVTYSRLFCLLEIKSQNIVRTYCVCINYSVFIIFYQTSFYSE